MKTFGIAAPFVSREEIEPLKTAGADELFCGYVDKESERLWPIFFQTINRRLKGASFENFTTFKDAVKEADRYNLPVYVTMNWHYTPEQYPWLIKTIKKISRLKGVKGIIVTDMGLLLTLRKTKYEKEIHISTGATVFNPKTADFFSSLGANRIILDRQLTTKEMIDIISKRKSNIGIEIFVFHTACLFIDGYCTFFHCGGANRNSELTKDLSLVKSKNTTLAQGCSEIRSLLSNKRFEMHSISGRGRRIKNFKFQPQKYPFGCNLCSLYELKDFPQITLKVIERGVKQIDTVKMIPKLIKYLTRKNISHKEYKKRAKEVFLKITGGRCNRFSCYCPSSLIRC